jgi:serine/threonine protein kinase
MRSVGKFDHKNIVRALDAGEVDGRLFIIMEYVDGENLDQLVKRKGPLPIHDACQIIHEAALTLQHVHETHQGRWR